MEAKGEVEKTRSGFESSWWKVSRKEKKNKKGKGVVEKIGNVKGGTGESSYQWAIACASHGSLSSMPHMKGGYHLSPGPHKVRSGNLR
jgi:hypothetical protein